MEISKNERIVVLINYFTRKVYAKLITTKEMVKMPKFLSEVHKEFKFEKIIADNGKEFNISEVKEWASNKNVKIEYSVPYFHASNGRVERVNRTLRNTLRKTKGQTKVKLRSVVNNITTSNMG